jgi:hypothetical protein
VWNQEEQLGLSDEPWNWGACPQDKPLHFLACSESLKNPSKTPICIFSQPSPSQVPLLHSVHCKHEKNKSQGKNKTTTKRKPSLPPSNLGEKKISSFFHHKQDFGFFFSPLIPFSFSLIKTGRLGLSLVGSVRHQNKKLNEKYLVQVQ